MRCKFRKRFWKVEIRDTWCGRKAGDHENGYCTAPDLPKRRIVLRRGQNNKMKFINAIHEGLHACCWDLSEETVKDSAVYLASYLRKLFEVTPSDVWD